WTYLLPGLIAGGNALVLTLSASVAIMTIVGYLTHGLSLRTSTALLGTFVGLALIAGLGAFGAWAASLNPITGDQDYQLAALLGTHGVATLRGIFLAGVVLAGLGVLNDVTITQVSAVWELRAANPAATWRDLLAGGMRIGRDHVASTIYTIAFAYVGAALPVLLMLQLYALPLARTLTGGVFAQEIIRTLAGSIGLVLAIPLTTAVAALVAVRSEPAVLRARGGHSHPASI
ncbi:MAG TPA: YibE/F family protein, partial [Propionicimonas sp.]